ncbi:MAG: TetR/AcrR family transcriptional regulator [Solirubrobacteraceae bacterium]
MNAADLPPAPRLPLRSGARARRPTRPRSLSREALVATALEIIDAEGLDAMTMRTVAHSLGTGAASLYAHVSGKEELLELVIERVIGELELPGEPDSERWQEQIKACSRSMRALFARHGDLARATFARIPLGENALRWSEWMIAVLRGAGLPEQVIAYACDLLPLYVMAHAYEESLFASEGTAPDQARAFVEDLRSYFASLPVERFPNVVSLAGPLTAGAEGDERFEFGLEVLLRGLAAMPG